MVGDIYVCIEDFQTVNSWYNVVSGKGTVKTGDRYEVIKEPSPEKKLYRLKKITKFDDEPILQVRKSVLKHYFKQEVQ